MKALIVEDNFIKRQHVIRILEQYEITDYQVEEVVSLAIMKAINSEFDIIITDLGLPRFADSGAVENEREGINMLYDLAYQHIKVPTIIYSETDVYEHQIEYLLKDLEYPFLGHVKDCEELEQKVKEFIETNQ